MQKLDERILEVFDMLRSNKEIRFYREICEKIDILEQNFSNIRKGKRSFTLEQIDEIIDIYKVNPNFIFGVSKKIFLE